MINLVALGIEVANGGIQTNKGLYYSWDIRLSTFFLGLIFLALYYKKYHLLHELVRTHFNEKNMVLHMTNLMYQVLSQEKQFNRHFIINCVRKLIKLKEGIQLPNARI